MENEENYDKRQRQRSPSYPSYPLKESIEITKKIYAQCGTAGHVDREQIARVLNQSVGTIQTKVSTCVQYGLLELKANEGYKPTHLFLDIYKPINEEERSAALIACFRKPKVYESIIKAYEGNVLPSKQVLGIFLFKKQNIADNASERVAEVFIENAKDLKVINEENVLKLSSTREADNSDAISKTDDKVDDKVRPSNVSPNEGISHLKNYNGVEASSPPMVINLKGNRFAYITFPEKITNDDCQRVIKFIEFYQDGIE